MSGAVQPLGPSLQEKNRGRARRAGGWPDGLGPSPPPFPGSPGCGGQGLAACCACVPPPATSPVIKFPYLSCLHHPHPPPPPRPLPNSNQNQQPCLLWACSPTPGSSRSPLSPSLQEVPASPVPSLSQMTESRAQKLSFNTSLIRAFPPPRATSSPIPTSRGDLWEAVPVAGAIPWERLQGGGQPLPFTMCQAHQMLQECSESWLPGEAAECSFFPMTFPFLLSGDSRGTTRHRWEPGASSLAKRPGSGRTRGSQDTLPVTGAESHWISSASASFSAAAPGTPRPVLVSSSSSLSSNSKASPGSSSASGEGPRPPPGTSGSPAREEELAALHGLRGEMAGRG